MSTTHTRYHNYSNNELLILLQDKRYYSPVVEELCQRIENLGSTCPVCEAELQLARTDLGD